MPKTLEYCRYLRFSKEQREIFRNSNILKQVPSTLREQTISKKWKEWKYNEKVFYNIDPTYEIAVKTNGEKRHTLKITPLYIRPQEIIGQLYTNVGSRQKKVKGPVITNCNCHIIIETFLKCKSSFCIEPNIEIELKREIQNDETSLYKLINECIDNTIKYQSIFSKDTGEEFDLFKTQGKTQAKLKLVYIIYEYEFFKTYLMNIMNSKNNTIKNTLMLKEELIEKAWNPDRFFEFCLCDDEKQGIKLRWFN